MDPAAVKMGQAALELARAAMAQRQQASPPPPPRPSPVEEAAGALLGKQSKLGVAQQAVLVDDLSKLAAADRANAQVLIDKTLGEDRAMPAKQDEDGTIIVCDDYDASTTVTPPPGNMLAIVLLVLGGLGLLGGTIAGAAWLLSRPASTPAATAAATPVPATAYDAVTEQLQPDGTWKEIGRQHLK